MDPLSRPWYRTFLIIFAGQAFSLLGSAAVNFALVWWLTAQTGSASILAYACIAALLPQGLLGLFIGPLIDRWDRRLIMICADLFVATASVVLLILFILEPPSPATVIGLIALRSIGGAFHTPASQAAVPMYVPSEHLMRVAGWNFFLTSGVAMAGPVLGALLMGVMPMGAVISLDIAGALLAVLSLTLVRIPHPEAMGRERSRRDFTGELREGWQELLRHPGLLALTVTIAGVTLVYMPLNALFPLMTFTQFQGGAVQASIAEFAFGTGMLAGSAGIGAVSARFSGVKLMGSGILVLGAAVGLSGLLPPSGFWGFAGLCVIMGVSVPLFGAPLTAIFQTLVEPSRLGRVMSLYMTMVTLVAPLGLVLAGPLAERTGISPWFAVSGVLLCAAGLVLRFLPAVRELDRALLAA